MKYERNRAAKGAREVAGNRSRCSRWNRIEIGYLYCNGNDNFSKNYDLLHKLGIDAYFSHAAGVSNGELEAQEGYKGALG